MARKLFSSKVRAEAHAELERVLADGQYPLAECRETADEYSVWTSSDTAQTEREVDHGG